MTHPDPQPHTPATVIALAARLLDRSKLELADELVAQVNGAFPDCLVARMLSLRLELARERAAEALAGTIDLLRIDPLNPEVLEIELQARRQLDASGDGIEAAARRLAAVAPGHPVLDGFAIAPNRAAIGFMHMRQGRHLLAERVFSEARATENWSELAVAIAQLQLEGGQVRAALNTSTQVLEQMPNCLPANLVFAQANAEFGRLALAGQHLQRTRRLDPEFALARRLYERLPVSRLELPPVPGLDLPEVLLARAQRALGPAPEPMPAAAPAPVPDPAELGEYHPPSSRFLPRPQDGGDPDVGAEAAPPAADPVVLTSAGDLGQLLAEDNWPLAIQLLEGTAKLLDAGFLAGLPSHCLARLGDELVRLDRPDLAAEAYRLDRRQRAPSAPDAPEAVPRTQN